jgi:HSP20 family molecular chaperone IbpA
MNYPDIRTYYNDKRQHFINPNVHRTHFLGRSALDVRWRMHTPVAKAGKGGLLFELELEMPGFKKEDIQINLDNDILTVKGKKKKLEKPASIYVIREFDVDVIERKFKLKEGVRYEKIDAEYNNGILKITFLDVVDDNGSSHRKIEIL